MQEIEFRPSLSWLTIFRTGSISLFFIVFLSGCVSSQALKGSDTAALTWSGTKDVRFVMAYKEETKTGYRLSGLVKDARGRHHKLSKSHVDAQFIGPDGSVIDEVQSRFRLLPRPRVVYRLARFSLDFTSSTQPVLEMRLYYHEAEDHEVR